MAGGIVGGGDVGAGQAGERVGEQPSLLGGRDITAVEEDVGVGGKDLAPRLN